MKVQAKGDFSEWITVGGNHFYPGYIIKGKERRLMIDAGINLMGPAYISSLEKIGKREGKLSDFFPSFARLKTNIE